MADGLRNRLTNATTAMFPNTRQSNITDKKRLLNVETNLASNLALQVILYFNAYYSGFWFIICIVTFVAKYEKLDSVYKFVLIVIYVIMAIIEIGRLYLGYTGNLQEKVPELAGFWLVTFILQLPLSCVLLLNETALIMPMERAANIILVLFIVFEIIQGYRAVKALTEHQVEKFHLKQFDDLIEMETLSNENVENVTFRG
eukprot:gene14265-15752_t